MQHTHTVIARMQPCAMALLLIGVFTVSATATGASQLDHRIAFLPEYEGLGVPSHRDSLQWLQKYLSSAPSFFKDASALPLDQAVAAPQAPLCGNYTPFESAGRSTAEQQPSKRRYLVLSAVGDGWTADRWLANAETRDFDLAVFHIGNDSNFSCAQCSHVFHSPGIKWELLRNLSFSPYWEGAAAWYRYFMYADDDLQMDACQLNKFFRTVEQFSLLLAQPSLCPGSVSWWEEMLTQRPELLLRYSTFVEIMAPTYDMGFFTAVLRHALFDTNFGYGSDNLWPAFLKYPTNRIGVVDLVCMGHPKRKPGQPGAGSIYKAQTSLPPPWEEHPRTLATFNLTGAWIDRHKGLPHIISEVRLLPSEPAAPLWRRQYRAAKALDRRQASYKMADQGAAAGLPVPVEQLLLAAAALLALMGLPLHVAVARKAAARNSKGAGH